MSDHVIEETCVDPEFLRATAVVADPDIPGRFHAELDAGWSAIRGVMGGYQAAVAVRAAEAVEPERAVRTVAASFLHPGQAGPVELDVEVQRRSRTFTTAAVSVRQAGRLVLVVRTTSVEAVTGHEWSTVPANLPVAPERAVPFRPPFEVASFDRADLRLDPATVPASDAADTRIAGYMRPLAGRHLDAAWLTAAGDWFPPTPFRRLQPPIGGVSVDYTVHVHRPATLGDGEWLGGIFESANSAGGLALEHGTLFVGDGTVVAETFHSRWTG